jgi:DNA polymerase III delta prime subunit
MKMLANVTKGKLKLPHLLLLYGPDGVGKSTFASEAPDPVFLGPERGTLNLDVSRFPTPQTWGDVVAATDELANNKHDFKTLVVDTLDWAEVLLYQEVCKRYGVNTIEKAAGGYGKGFREAFNDMVEFRHKLSFLRENKGMNIILLAHSKVVVFEDPTTDHGYSRFELKLQESKEVSIKSMWREYVDAVLFCNFETFSKGEGKSARGVTARERKMWTERDAGFDAKNRFDLPFEMPLEFKTYAKAVEASSTVETSDQVFLRIVKKSAALDDDLKVKVMDQTEKHRNNVAQLKKIEDRINLKLGEV